MLQKKQWGCPQMPVDGILCFAVILLTHVYFKRASQGSQLPESLPDALQIMAVLFCCCCLDGP